MTSSGRIGALLVLVTALGGATLTRAASPSQKCQAGKNREAGKYATCRQNAEATFALTANASVRTTLFNRCLSKLSARWRALERKAGGSCPSNGDAAVIEAIIDAHTTTIATALAGGGTPGCTGDLLTCQANLGTCDGSLTSCQTDLGTCRAGTVTIVLQTGQTTCFDAAGTPVACAGTGQDGELRAGRARGYVDHGDGTITDTATGLMWEKLSDDGGIHDKDNSYDWTSAFATKVAALNGSGGFAGHTDWRLPNRSELESLVDISSAFPAVAAAFNSACAPGCVSTTCSCALSSDASKDFWSSSSVAGFAASGWTVSFNIGFVGGSPKTAPQLVRAVRGGL